MATGRLVRRDRDRRIDARGWLLFLVCFAMLIVSLDQYIVVVALPDIGRALGYSAHTLQLVVSAYAVASSGFLLLGGRAADLLGRRRMLATGLVLYAVASFAGGLATGPATQLTCPSGAGPGRGTGVPRDPGRRSRPPTGQGRDRNRALGIWGAAGAAGLVVGVLAGGVLTRYLGWSVGVLRQRAAGPRRAGHDVRRRAAGPAARPDPPVRPGRCADRDVVGDAGGLGPGTGPAAGLERGRRSALPVVLGLLLGWVFTRIERRARDPLMPRALVRNPFVRLAVVLAFLFMATFGSLLYFVSIYLQNVLGYDALQTGLGFVVPTALVVAASALAGPVSTRIGLRATCLAALAVGAVGAAVLAYALTADAAYVELLPGLLLVSIGDGTMFTAIFIAAATGVEPRRQGVASAIVSTGIGNRGRRRPGAAGAAGRSRSPEPVDAEALRIATADGIRSAVYAIAAAIAVTFVFVLAGYPRSRSTNCESPPRPRAHRARLRTQRRI